MSELKKELKAMWSNKFLNDLEVILEKCFLINKKKKEHFITKEKLEVDLIKLLQSQSKFLPATDIKENLSKMALYDKVTNVVGRIMTVDLINLTVTFEDIFMKVKTLSFDDVEFFDTYSVKAVAMFDRQKMFYDKFTYRDTYRFLMKEDLKVEEETKELTRYSAGRGMPLTIKVDYGKY